MHGWEQWVIAISSIIIALGMMVMITAFILLIVALRRLISGASKIFGFLRFSQSDPVGELMGSFQSFFQRKGKAIKVASLVKCALIGFILWQKISKRRK